MRYLLREKRVFIFKEDLATEPKFYLFLRDLGDPCDLPAISGRRRAADPQGQRAYYAWCLFLLVLIGAGAYAYLKEFLGDGPTSNMSDSVSWGFYIGNYTFLVGVAAAAIMLVIPAYIYHWQPIKEIVILGELLAISAVVMVFGFVMVDMGHPERFWHMMPGSAR